MAEVTANVSIWHIRAGDMELTPNEQAPQLLRLDVCEDVRIVLDRDSADTAEQAAAMRRLAELAAEAAQDLERHVKAPEGGAV
jgi:hypothetical protein